MAALLVMPAVLLGQWQGIAPPTAVSVVHQTDHPVHPPEHEILFGYYALEGRDGSHTEQALPYTNLDIVEPGAWWTGEDVHGYTEWTSHLANQLTSSTAWGRRVHLMLGNGRGREDPRGFWPDWDEILTVAAPFWDSIVKLEIFHEDDLDPAETRARIDRLERLLVKMRLERKPIGGILFKKENWSAPGLDWIGIEAYVTTRDVALYTDSAAAEAYVLEKLKTDLAALPPGVKANIIMMGYRLGGVTTDDVIFAVQWPAYEAARTDPRVDTLTIFSYSRRGGTRDHAKVKALHEAMGAAIRTRYPHGFNP
jgi:hypothetical protein